MKRYCLVKHWATRSEKDKGWEHVIPLLESVSYGVLQQSTHSLVSRFL